MALSRQKVLRRLNGLEDAVLWHLNEHVPETIAVAPTAIAYWRVEVTGFLNDMERLAASANLGRKTSTEWQGRIAELRSRLDDLLGG